MWCVMKNAPVYLQGLKVVRMDWHTDLELHLSGPIKNFCSGTTEYNLSEKNIYIDCEYMNRHHLDELVLFVSVLEGKEDSIDEIISYIKWWYDVDITKIKFVYVETEQFPEWKEYQDKYNKRQSD